MLTRSDVNLKNIKRDYKRNIQFVKLTFRLMFNRIEIVDKRFIYQQSEESLSGVVKVPIKLRLNLRHR